MASYSSKIINALKVFKSLYAIKLLKTRIPVYCEWELTNFCNMSCYFCSTYTNDRNAANDISEERANEILDQLEEMGTLILHFSGGEPTLWKGFSRLVQRAKSKNMIVSFTTNGSASQKLMESVIETDIIRISIDGPQRLHDSGRGYPGAFARAIENIRFLKSRGVSPLITTVFKEDTSRQDLEDLAKLASDLGVQISLNIFSKNLYSGEMAKNDSTETKDSLHADFFRIIDEVRLKYPKVFANPEPYLTILKLGGLNNYGCRAMDVSISIKPDGSVWLPCTGLGKITSKRNLKEVFFSQEAEELLDLQGKDEGCIPCTIRCMSSASALLNFRTQVSIFDSYCRSFF